MTHSEWILLSLSSVFVLGIASQWIASRLRIPSILLLLTVGVLAGPVFGVIDSDELLGDLLLPAVSLAVAVVLFEGSLSLRLSDLKRIGKPLAMLLSVGVMVTWILAYAGAYWILQFDHAQALLIGAILTVTGPTVIGPMLREIRPTGQAGPIARWEGIVIDPVGAVLAVLIFGAETAAISDQFNHAAMHGVAGFLKTILIGTAIGLAVAFALRELLRLHWITDHLQSPFALMMVVAAFVASNLLQHESGLVAVTVMGLVLANQTKVEVRHIVEFKENLSVLLISSLFVILAARLDLNDVRSLSWRGISFVAYLIVIVRPAAVWVSAFGTSLTTKEKLFLSWLAPRGIVAAAVASVFALQMDNSEEFVTAVFLVIIGTVLVYGLTAGWVARRLGLSVANPQGVLFAGAHSFSRSFAKVLAEQKIPVCLVDTNASNLQAARMDGLPTYYANVLSEKVLDEVDLGGIGRLLSVTPNDEVNSLAAQRFTEVFGRKEVYRICSESSGSQRQDKSEHVMTGRELFEEGATFRQIQKRVDMGAVIKATTVTEEFRLEDFFERHGENSIILATLTDTGILTIYATDVQHNIQPGQTIITLVDQQPAA